MTRHILLHIGMPKCGSTYLQRVFLQNRETLAQAGFHYPHEDPDNGHPGNGAGIPELHAADLEALFDGHRHLILSHEDLFAQGARAEAFASAVQELGAEVQILAFIRPFSEFVFGDYSQNMKQNFGHFVETRVPYQGRNFEQFTVDRARTLNPVMRFRGWTNRLADAQFHLYSHRMIRPALTELLDLPELNWSVPRYKSNPSLRMEDCDRLAEMIRDPEIASTDIAEERRQAFRRAGEPDPGRSPERVAWIEAIFSRQNEDLMQVYGYDNHPSAVPDPVPVKAAGKNVGASPDMPTEAEAAGSE